MAANPLQHTGGGWRFGTHGHLYKGRGARAKAARQGRAIEWRKHGGLHPRGYALRSNPLSNLSTTELVVGGVLVLGIVGVVGFLIAQNQANSTITQLAQQVPPVNANVSGASVSTPGSQPSVQGAPPQSAVPLAPPLSAFPNTNPSGSLFS